jgi:hypothetical protein
VLLRGAQVTDLFTENELTRWRRRHPPCPDCGVAPWREHLPYCSKAPLEVQAAYARAMRDHPSWRDR